MKVLVVQSCPTLGDPMDCKHPGSSVHEILQARGLEWGAIPFSRGSSQPREWSQVSCFADRFFTIWAIREAKCTINVMCLNHSKTSPPHPSPWKNCLPRSWSLVPNRVGTTGLQRRLYFLCFKTSIIVSTPSPTTPWTLPSPWQLQGQRGPQSNILKDFSS